MLARVKEFKDTLKFKVLFWMYLCTEQPLSDLWDVGVGCIQCVKIHLVELVIKLLS